MRARFGGVLLQLGETSRADEGAVAGGARDGLGARTGREAAEPDARAVLERLGRAQIAQGDVDAAARSLDAAMQLLGQQFVPDLDARARVWSDGAACA